MTHLHWPEYVAVAGMVLFLWCGIFLTIWMQEQKEKYWVGAAEWFPIVTHLCFVVIHWRQVPWTIFGGIVGACLVAAGIYWQK